MVNTNLVEGEERLELRPEAAHILGVAEDDDPARQVEQLDVVEGVPEVCLGIEVWVTGKKRLGRLGFAQQYGRG